MNCCKKIVALVTLIACGSLYAAPNAQDKEKERLLALKMQAKIPSAQITAPATSFNVSYNTMSEDQVKQTSLLDTEIVRLDNELRELQKSKEDQTKQQQLGELIKSLRQKKAAEDRLTSHLNQLGALDAALQYNKELLVRIGDELQQLKNLELKNINRQRDDLEKQRQKLENVLSALQSKRDNASLKVASLRHK